MNPSSPVLFCTACAQPFDPAEFAAGTPQCRDCHSVLVGPHSEPCPTCRGPVTPDGFMCVRCGPITQEIGDGKARLKTLLKSFFVGGLGGFLLWQAISSVQSGVFRIARRFVSYNVVREDEPVWFWVNVSLTGIVAVLMIVVFLVMAYSSWKNRDLVT